MGGFALLEVILFLSASSAQSEGPLWLTAIAVVPPMLMITAVVELLARRQTPLVMQIVIGTIVGLVGYIIIAFVAYAGYLTLS
jgi:hypothetical protein